jgi:hypothetical protein
MPQFIDSSGEIEIVSLSSRAARFTLGERVQLVFKLVDIANPPYKLSVTSPNGKIIVDQIIRDLPTGEPQSPPPFEFTPSITGVYKVEIREMRGRAYGKGDLKV